MYPTTINKGISLIRSLSILSFEYINNNTGLIEPKNKIILVKKYLGLKKFYQ